MKITEQEFAQLKDSLVYKDDHTNHELIVALSEVTYMHSQKTTKMEEKKWLK
tara:strand:+ start:13332 stop:13487 length:156 start_codon:yes stop_codon:yes gene_type:complete